MTDTEELYQRTRTLTLTADKLGNGAKELLDEVATGKVTGEEEAWSHTDLWDFQANVDGARIAFESLRPILDQKNPELAKELDTRFESLQTELTKYAKGDGFIYYDELTPEQVQEPGHAGGRPGRAPLQADGGRSAMSPTVSRRRTLFPGRGRRRGSSRRPDGGAPRPRRPGRLVRPESTGK